MLQILSFLNFIFVFTPFLHVKLLVRLQSQSRHFYTLVLGNLVLSGCENFTFGQNNLAECSSMLTMLIFNCGSHLTQGAWFHVCSGTWNYQHLFIPMEKLVKVCTILRGLSVKSCGSNAQSCSFEHNLLSENAFQICS